MSVYNKSIMNDDSLAVRWFRGHDYNRSLVGDSLVDETSDMREIYQDGQTDSAGSYFNDLADFLSSLPTFVYVILGVVLAACLAYWISKSGLFYRNPVLNAGDDVDEADDIYTIDIDEELAAARQQINHEAMVRLIYLHTLRYLDENQRIDWRIYKTPSQYAQEYAHPSFVRMTHHFLRVRYGGFPASQALSSEMETLSHEVQKGGEA